MRLTELSHPTPTSLPPPHTHRSQYGVESEYLTGCVSRAFVDQTEFLVHTAWFNLLRTTMIMLVLGSGTFFINHDAEELIITPVKRMTK